MDSVYRVAEHWRAAVAGVDRPWLCWNVNDDWCVFQQKLVLSVGWTPIVGWDPNCGVGAPPLMHGAIAVDFNEGLGYEALWPHFPLEFAFMWTERLAFWHADLLVRIDKLKKYANLFAQLKDGEMAAVPSRGGVRNMLRRRTHRYWELLGCMTRGASESQFKLGCGWWRNFYRHPQTPPEEADQRSKYYYDSGVGIMYWKRRYAGKVLDISERTLREGHFTKVGNANYVHRGNKGQELAENFDISDAAKRLGLESFL